MTNTIFHGVSNLPKTYDPWKQRVSKRDFEVQLRQEIAARHRDEIYKLPNVVQYDVEKDSSLDEYIIVLYLSLDARDSDIYPDEIGGLKTKRQFTLFM